MNNEWEASFRKILLGHTVRYPLWEIQDLYKLIHQAAMGSEHAISDFTAAQAWLDREIKTLEEGPQEPTVDPISPGGAIVRVNLRPYLAMAGDPHVLLKAFVQTANEYPGSQEELIRYWTTAEQVAEDNKLPFKHAAMQKFFAPLKTQNFPALHHSEVYEASYHPAYRVVSNIILEQIQRDG
jgi:hypothetical protein